MIIMNNLWLEWLINKFITETDIRCCSSCQGGCINPAVCFLCCGFTMNTLDGYAQRKGIDNLKAEFEKYLQEDFQEEEV